MSNFETLLRETEGDMKRHIISHSIVNHVLSGRMTCGEYLSYLTETYHMVRHTPRMLSLAAARLDDSARELRDWFIEQAAEEANHDVFCIKDIRHLGHDPEVVLQRPPLAGSWGLVTQNYFMASHGRPEGILGVASLTEGLGASLAGEMATALTEQYGLPTNTTTFLRSHSGFDAQHLEDCKRAIDTLITTDAAFDAVKHARRMTIILYGQLFTDALTSPINTKPPKSVSAMPEFMKAS